MGGVDLPRCGPAARGRFLGRGLQVAALKKSNFNVVFPARDGAGHVFYNRLTHLVDVLDDDARRAFAEGRLDEPPHLRARERLQAIGCLVPSGRNETKLLRAYYQRFVKPFQLTVELSRVCNFKCLYCYQNGTHDASKVIRPDVLEASLRYARHVLATGQVNEFELNLIGGEPLAHKAEILRLYRPLRDLLDGRPGIRWRVTFDTNGSLFTDAFLAECRNTTFSVSLTSRADHDRKRPYVDGRASYDAIVGALLQHREHFERHGNVLVVRYNLDHENRGQMLAFLREIAGWRIRGLSFMLVNVVNHAFNQPYVNRLSEDEFRDTCGEALDAMVDLGLAVKLVPFGVISPCHVFTPYSCKVFHDGRLNGCDVADVPGEGSIFELSSGASFRGREVANALTHKLCQGDYKICNMEVFPLQSYLSSYLRAVAHGRAHLFDAFADHGRRMRANLRELLVDEAQALDRRGPSAQVAGGPPA